MELLKGIKSVLGGSADAQTPTGEETVERLVERMNSSVLLEDRRDACRGLKALSKKYRLEVGTKAMDGFVQILENDRTDPEIIGFVLEALCNIISGIQEEDEMGSVPKFDERLGFQFTEIFLKKQENVILLLNLMEEYDFRVRWPVVKLMTALLVHKTKELQDCMLLSATSVSRLMDLLSDPREIIRNDTLLLLAHLTKGNANIQKIVAFENAFEKILNIIQTEGYSDGGIIVEDCLMVLLTLLKNNNSNQTYFKESSYIQHLTPFFELQECAENGWTNQKVSNILLMLKVCRILVSPNNTQQITNAAQKAMSQCGLLAQFCNILMVSGVSADILTEVINTVAEIIRGNTSNQKYFSTIMAPTTPPKSAIVILLMSMVNEKQHFFLRCAVLYCFQCFLYKNDIGQAEIVQTLLPSCTDAQTVSVGQLLCGGLFSLDALSNWFAAVAMSHALINNRTQKEQLIRVQLATGSGNPPVSLISHLSVMLQQGGKAQTRLGLLMLMCTWLADCPKAVEQFLGIATNIPFLNSQVNLAEHDESEDLVQGMCTFLLGLCIEFNDNTQLTEPNCSKDDLCQIVVKRIGLETFRNKLLLVSKSEYYIRSSQNPHLKFQQPSEVLFDYEFCMLFKSLEGAVIKSVEPKSSINGSNSLLSSEQLEDVLYYKNMIREQDISIKSLTLQLNSVSDQYESMKTKFDESSSTIEQLRDQLALMKAQKGSWSGSQDLSSRDEVEMLKNQCELLQKELAQSNEEKRQLQLQGNSSGEQHKELSMFFESSQQTTETLSQHTQVTEKLEAKVHQLQKDIEEKNELIDQLKIGIPTMEEGENVAQAILSADQEDKINTLEARLRELESEVEVLRKSNMEFKDLQTVYHQVCEEKDTLESELKKKQEEQEDMLVLLTEQGDKLEVLKGRLKKLGQSVTDDEDEEDDDDLDGDDPDELDDSNDDETCNETTDKSGAIDSTGSTAVNCS